MVRGLLPLFAVAAEGSKPRAGAARTQMEQHGTARSGAELFGTLELTSHGIVLVSSLRSLMPRSTRAR